MFDTGAYTSLLTLKAAKRAGVTPDSPGVMPAGTSSGIGRRTVQTWIGPFASFKLGDEEVRNTRLRFGAEAMHDVDMLIGADFFLSHHVYVANSQHKLYFTYNGGAVFDLRAAGSEPPRAPATGTAAAPDRSSADSSPPQGASADAPPGGRPAVAAGVGGPATAGPAQAVAAAATPVRSGRPAGQPADASGFARRGAAFAARRDFERAIADLTRACELAPTEAEYFYQRGLAHSANGQAEPALADLERAIELKPDHLSALLVRAGLRVRRGEFPAAIADLGNADRVALKGGEVRMDMARLYVNVGQYAAAVAQATQWIDGHGRDDVQMPAARNFRCRARALWGQELEQALEDCDAAVKRGPKAATFLVSRGLVQLRRRDYDKAIADYDRAQSLGSKDAWLYYGRGVARLRKGMTAAGQADIAAATALEPAIAEEAGKRGLAP
jgi:tetratricopeptide (TPR) repeat protein